MAELNTTDFNSDFYLRLHADVNRGVQDPNIPMTAIDHYNIFGVNEGRISNRAWDEDAYLEAYPDVASQVSNGDIASGLAHFSTSGMDEGRRGYYNIDFDSSLDSQGYYVDGFDTFLEGNSLTLLWGNHLNDALSGNELNNHLRGSSGDDILSGYGGDDVLYGGSGKDTLVGGTGRDELFGGDGNDKLYGNEDWDEIFGGAGDDLLQGGSGKDVLQGQSGNDTYVFRAGDSLDIISDEGNSTGDTIFFDASINFEDVTFEQVAGKAHIDIVTGGAGDRVRVINQLAPFDTNRIEIFNFNRNVILTAEDVSGMLA